MPSLERQLAKLLDKNLQEGQKPFGSQKLFSKYNKEEDDGDSGIGELVFGSHPVLSIAAQFSGIAGEQKLPAQAINDPRIKDQIDKNPELRKQLDHRHEQKLKQKATPTSTPTLTR